MFSLRFTNAHAIEEVAEMVNGNNDHNGYVDPMTIQRYLRNIDYPCSKEELVEKAKEAGADDEVVETLEEMPDEIFESPADVAQSIGRIM